MKQYFIMFAAGLGLIFLSALFLFSKYAPVHQDTSISIYTDGNTRLMSSTNPLFAKARSLIEAIYTHPNGALLEAVEPWTITAIEQGMAVEITYNHPVSLLINTDGLRGSVIIQPYYITASRIMIALKGRYGGMMLLDHGTGYFDSGPLYSEDFAAMQSLVSLTTGD